MQIFRSRRFRSSHADRFFAATLCTAFALAAGAQQVTTTVTSHSEARNTEAVFARATEASAIVLTGEGAGRLKGMATAVIVRPDGILLTAYHVVRDAQEVQVRLHNGEAYDRVELIGFDERRDVAALRIAASGLAALPLGDSAELHTGDPLYAVTQSGALQWSADAGIFAALRPADEVSGAGEGYRLLQTTLPVHPGASGGPLVDSKGKLVGIFVARASGASFAVPIEAVAGLAQGGMHTALGTGAALHMPQQERERSPEAARVAATKPSELLRSAHTVVIVSKTAFFTPETLERTLAMDENWKALGLVLVKDRRVADLVIELDRPIFTYVHTYTVYDPKTTIVLLSGKHTAFDGTIASGEIAKQIGRELAKQKPASTAIKSSAS